MDDRASFRRFCGFSSAEPTPERTAFVRFRKVLVAARLDRALFEAVRAQPTAKAVRVKTGAIVDATIISSASKVDDDHAGPDALPDAPGEVFADSAYRGALFREAVQAKGGTPRIAATGMWDATKTRRWRG
jgi:IS5 family transposase